MEYKYRVSIIVPVCNVEKYVGSCLDSLLNQTMPQEDMEILVVNDGSTDSSYEICQEYARKYDCIKLFTKENEGLSATRNYGIVRAQGKYMMYIDSDDSFTAETVKSVVDFFDTVYDQVDLVTYFEQPYNLKGNMIPHFRYKYFLKEQGVYDLNEYPYIVQTRVNVCVKNLFEKNELFDTTPGFKQEDQEYNNRILLEKMKLGYCSKGCYRYNKSNEDSIVSISFHAFYLFETSTAYFERLFQQFPEKVPVYFQAMLMNDLRWKLQSKILYPFHYEGTAWENAINRIKALLAKVDVDTIIKDPLLSTAHKCYWISMKPNAAPTVYADQNSTGVLYNGKFIYHSKNIVVNLVKIDVTDDQKLLVRVYVEAPLYNFTDEPAQVYICENGNKKQMKQLPVYLSKFGYVKTNVRTNNYYAAEYLCDPEKVTSFQHYVKLNGYLIPARYGFAETAVFAHSRKVYSLLKANTRIRYHKDVFYLKRLSGKWVRKFELWNAEMPHIDGPDKRLREKALKLYDSKRIWLYSDLYTVKKDNGYFQFINDFGHQDGIDRYYVYTRPYEEIIHLFTPEQQEYLVAFGSEQHKLLYLASRLILSGFYGRTPVSPFKTFTEEQRYADIEHFKVIYLQHGVLHASLYVQNSAENAWADKVVISTPFEKKNLMEKYNYRPENLIETAMSRYDHIDRTKPAQRKILFAPSWRNYLAPNTSASSWSVNLKKLQSSEYFKNMQAFIQSPTLHALLEKYDMTLELKLHPIIASAAGLFTITTDRITYAAEEVDVADYCIFMTDFSSFVFDYACLSRPILYFVPDYLQFKSGMGHYRDLDLPFEDAFGPLSLTAEDTISNLKQILEHNCVAQPKYKDRMDHFYYNLDHCAERLYQCIMDSNMAN